VFQETEKAMGRFWTDLDEIFMVDGKWNKNEVIKF